MSGASNTCQDHQGLVSPIPLFHPRLKRSQLMGQECGEINRSGWQKAANVQFQNSALSSFWQNVEKNACDPTKIVDVGKWEGDGQGRESTAGQDVDLTFH